MTSRRLLALGAIAVLTGAACSPPAGTPTTAPPTSAASTTPSPAETPPEETTAPTVPAPDPADFPGKDEHTEEGAKQAVRYYWAMLVWGYETGDTEILQGLHLETCGNCVDNLESIGYAKDHDKLWSDASITDEDVYIGEPGEYETVVQYVFIVGAHDEPDYDSSDVNAKPDTRYFTANGMTWRDDRWLMEGSAIEIETVDDSAE